jgi:hypothetical protein
LSPNSVQSSSAKSPERSVDNAIHPAAAKAISQSQTACIKMKFPGILAGNLSIKPIFAYTYRQINQAFLLQTLLLAFHFLVTTFIKTAS